MSDLPLATTFIVLVVVPIIILCLGVYLLKKHSKKKTDFLLAGLSIGLGVGWLLIGLAFFLTSIKT